MTAPMTASGGTLVEAAACARRRRYDDARRLLAQLGGKESDDVAVLDLLARVHVQQGDLLAADDCWARALILDRDHAGSRRGRRRIALILSRRYRPATGRRLGSAALAVALVAGGTALGHELSGGGGPADQRVLAELAQRVGRLDAGTDPATARRQELHRLAGELGGPGRTVYVRRTDLLVSFPAPVFTEHARLSPAGRRALAAVARRLPDGVEVTVVGHTDDVPVPTGRRYADNVELGLARALAAARVVAREGHVPLGTVAVASAGSANPPYADTTAQGRRRNRTVTLVLRPG